MKRYAILFCILLTGGCGASRAAHPVVFQNETPFGIDRKFSDYFEKALSKKTTASVVVYRIKTLEEGSRFKRLFGHNAGAAQAWIWSRGTAHDGSVLWDRDERSICRHGFESIYSCFDEIAEALP
jgi:hypothetical protein